MTPLYDVMSAFPLMHPTGIPAKKAKMAMAVLGNNRHFHWDRILPRHFVSTAQRVSYSQENVSAMMKEMKEKTEQVIAEVEARLPVDFPAKISHAIFEGLRRQAARLP